MHQTQSGFWGFPKGHLERNESYVAAAIRETREEVGVKLEPAQLGYFREARQLRIYVVKMDPTVVRIDGVEIDQYAWLTLDELSTLPISNDTKRILQQF